MLTHYQVVTMLKEELGDKVDALPDVSSSTKHYKDNNTPLYWQVFARTSNQRRFLRDYHISEQVAIIYNVGTRLPDFSPWPAGPAVITDESALERVPLEDKLALVSAFDRLSGQRVYRDLEKKD